MEEQRLGARAAAGEISAPSFGKMTVHFCIILLLLLLSSCETRTRTDREWIEHRIGVDIGNLELLSSEDDHGGFHGDGVAFYIFACDEQQFLMIKTEWQPLPLPEDVSLFLYGGEKDGVTYGPRGLTGAGSRLPQVSSGAYFFVDRGEEQEQPLLQRHSNNISILLYDVEYQRLYYFEFDS